MVICVNRYAFLNRLKVKTMNKEDNKLNEQQAPEKNTDAAFVQVGTDGKPVMPDADQTEQTTDANTPKQGTLADR